MHFAHQHILEKRVGGSHLEQRINVDLAQRTVVHGHNRGCAHRVMNQTDLAEVVTDPKLANLLLHQLFRFKVKVVDTDRAYALLYYIHGVSLAVSLLDNLNFRFKIFQLCRVA